MRYLQTTLPIHKLENLHKTPVEEFQSFDMACDVLSPLTASIKMIRTPTSIAESEWCSPLMDGLQPDVLGASSVFTKLHF